MSELALQAERTSQGLEQKRQQMAALAGLSMINGDYGGLHNTTWEPQQKHLREMQVQINKIEMEPHRRWSTGF